MSGTDMKGPGASVAASTTPELPSEFVRVLEEASGKALFITRNNVLAARAVAQASPRLAWTVRTKDDLRGWGAGRIVKLLRSRPWKVVVFEDYDYEFPRRRDLYLLMLLLGRGASRWMLSSGATMIEGFPVRAVVDLPRALGVLFAEKWTTLGALWTAHRLTQTLEGKHVPPRRAAPDPANPRIAYLKTDFWFGLKAGGSVSHVIGVMGGMRSLGLEPRFWTASPIPGVERHAEQVAVPPARRPALIDEAALAAYNRRFLSEVEPQVRAFDPAVIYQRHGVFSLVGLALARRLGVPLVLEVNGSEVWVREAWSRLYFAGLARRMERTAFAGADRLILVSNALRPTVGKLGGDEARMVVNTNGVDVTRFHPEDRGEALRTRLGIPADAIVCGFTGTFTKWHGVLFLAEQIEPLAAAHPGLHFLLLGDGDMQPQCRKIVEEAGLASRVRFTGMLPLDEVPEHLAACDILLSPHLPLEDGTEFFFSPTKLFEYMAVGRPTVASDLGQNGEVVLEGETGLLYPPGDGEAFRRAVLDLAADPALRASMGARGRAEAVARYTWEANVRRSLAGLVALPDSPA